MGSGLSQSGAATSQQQLASRSSAQQPSVPSSRFNGSLSSQGAPQLGSLPFQASSVTQLPSSQPPPQSGPGGPNPLQQHPTNQLPSGQLQPRQQTPPRSQSPRPVFGVPLSRLYERDGLAVPMVVYQCIQAVDLYGLGVEGIYRLSGSMPHVNKLKSMFDIGTYLRIISYTSSFPFPSPTQPKWKKPLTHFH